MTDSTQVIDSEGTKWEYEIIKTNDGYTVKEYKNNSFSYKWNRETKEKALLLVEHWLYKYSD